jgi:hypothetical protein
MVYELIICKYKNTKIWTYNFYLRFHVLKLGFVQIIVVFKFWHFTLKVLFNPLNSELNTIRHLLGLAGDHHFVDVSRIRVKQKFRKDVLASLLQAKETFRSGYWNNLEDTKLHLCHNKDGGSTFFWNVETNFYCIM